MVDVFKVLIQDNGPKHLRTLFEEYEHPYNTTSIRSLDLPKYRAVKCGRIRFHGVKLWNLLDMSIKCAIELKSFKDRIRFWHGQDCTCQAYVFYVF